MAMSHWRKFVAKNPMVSSAKEQGFNVVKVQLASGFNYPNGLTERLYTCIRHAELDLAEVQCAANCDRAGTKELGTVH